MNPGRPSLTYGGVLVSITRWNAAPLARILSSSVCSSSVGTPTTLPLYETSVGQLTVKVLLEQVNCMSTLLALLQSKIKFYGSFTLRCIFQ